MAVTASLPLPRIQPRQLDHRPGPRVPRRVHLHQDGQLAAPGRLGPREVNRPRPQLHALAVLCRLQVRVPQPLPHAARGGDRARRPGRVQHRVLEGAAGGGRRDPPLARQQQAELAELHALGGAAKLDQGHQCAAPALEDQELARPFDGCCQAGSDRDKKGERFSPSLKFL